MGLLSGLAKAGVAQKLISEARKPQNQQKAKDLFATVKDKVQSRGQSGQETRPSDLTVTQDPDAQPRRDGGTGVGS